MPRPRTGAPGSGDSCRAKRCGGGPWRMSRTALVEQRAMQRVKMRQQRSNLGQERIGEDRGDLFVAAAAGVAHQLADVHLESLASRSSEPSVGMALPFSILEM